MSNLQEQSEQARLARAIEAHPLLKGKMDEIKAEAEQKRDAQVAVLRAEIADLDSSCVAFDRAVNALEQQREEAWQEYQGKLAELLKEADAQQSARAANRDQRRAAYHRIQQLQGDRPAGPACHWLTNEPDWFKDQVQTQKNRDPRPSFEPPMREVVTYHGNRPVITLVSMA